MVPIRGEWTRFIDEEDQIAHYRLWGLIPPKSTALRPVMVVDGYLGIPEPCNVVGYQSDNWAVIELDDGYHAIHGEYLAELQPEACQRLPRGLCFVEVLSNYVIFDIETTGLDKTQDRIIELAAAKYEYGNLVDTFETLVNPEMMIPARITKLTSITQSDIASAPTLESIMPKFLQFIGTLPLVGHNAASFDVPFLAAKIHQNIDNPVVDTIPLVKKAFPLLSHHNLDYLKHVLRLNSKPSHRAANDVETTAAVLWASLAPRRYENFIFEASLNNSTVHSPRGASVSNSHPTPRKAPYEKIDIKSIKPTTTSFDISHPLYKKNILFTGELTISRNEAIQLAVDCGAQVKSSVSRKIDFLIVGIQDISVVGKDGISNKEREAAELNRLGKANISIIKENEFLDLVHGISNSDEPEQFDFLSFSLSEEDVYKLLLPHLSNVILQNNVAQNRLVLKEGKAYSSVWYDTQMAFRICCRDNHHYFGVSNIYAVSIPESLCSSITKDGRSDGFTNFEFSVTQNGVLKFSNYLASILDMSIDSTSKEFDCCSRFEECSNAKRCINPNVDIATGCGYRRIMKKDRIYYGKNRNID